MTSVSCHLPLFPYLILQRLNPAASFAGRDHKSLGGVVPVPQVSSAPSARPFAPAYAPSFVVPNENDALRHQSLRKESGTGPVVPPPAKK